MEKGADGTMLFYRLANAGQHQDTGAKMIHNAPRATVYRHLNPY